MTKLKKATVTTALSLVLWLMPQFSFAGFWDDLIDSWGGFKTYLIWMGQGASELVEWWNSDKIDKYKPYIEDHPSLSAPKVELVNIDDYCETRDLIGVKDEDEVFLILTEDYTYYDSYGKKRTIPAGFIFDGASVPDFARYVIQGAPIDPTLLVPGLIHDYMYRCGVYEYKMEILGGLDFKTYADEMLYVNAFIAGNQNPGSIYTGVAIELPDWKWFFPDDAGDAFDWHLHHWQEYYQKFTPEYYRHNLEKLEKYRNRWTTDQLLHREGVSIDNEDCAECKIGGKDPNIVDNRPDTGDGGTGGSDVVGGGSGGGGDGSVSGSGSGSGDGPGTGGGEPPMTTIDPGYGLPEVTVPLPDVVLPNGDGTRPWDDIVGFEVQYDRMLFFLSGDYPSGSDFESAFNALLNLKRQIANQTERKSGELSSDSQKIGQR